MKRFFKIFLVFTIFIQCCGNIGVYAASYSPWSFVIAPDFFSDGTMSYADTGSFEEAYDYSVQNGKEGFFISNSKWYGTDRHWSAFIESSPQDESVHFVTGLYENVKTGVAACFTVPKSGFYDIYCHAENRGLVQTDGSWYYSDKGMARISIITPSNLIENLGNCIDFPVGNKGMSGVDGKNGEYKSGAVYLAKNTRVYLRMFSGTSFAGSDYYAEFSVTHVDYTENSIMKYSLSAPGESREIFTAESDYLKSDNLTVNGEGTDSSGGVWSVFKSTAFYDNNSTLDGYSYRNISDFVPIERRISGEGDYNIVYRSNLAAQSVDRNWMSLLKIQSGRTDSRVQLMVAGNKYLSENDGITTMFTIPKDGSYTVDFDIENRGLSGVFGSGNMARVSILRNGETVETRQNSRDFEVRNTDGSRGSGVFDSGRVKLSANDRIVFSVYGGLDWYGDDFYAKYIVNQVDMYGNIICSYDLSKTNYSNVGNWRFGLSENTSENPDDFKRLAVLENDNNEISAVDFEGICKTPAESTGCTEIVRRIKDSAAEMFLRDNKDIVIAYEPSEAGNYQFFTDISKLSGTVNVTAYKNSEKLSAAIVSGDTTVRSVCRLETNDIYYLRFSKNENVADVSLAFDIRTCNKEEKPAKAERNVINVMDYGAVGDGKTDDQAALENAFHNACIMQKDVYLPAGTYLHSDILKADGIHVFGDGAQRTALVSLNDTKACVELTGTDAGIFEIGLFGAEGDRTSINEASAIYVNRAENFIISGCRIRKFSGAGIIVKYSSYGSIFNNYIENTRADGIHTVALSNNIEVMYNTVYASGDDCISFTSYKKDGGMTAHNKAYGNCVYALPGSRGIVSCGGEDTKIFSNYIDSGVQGVAVAENISWDSLENNRISVYDNTIKNTYINKYPESGAAVSLYNDNGIECNGIEVINNDLYNPCFYGLRAAGNAAIAFNFERNICYFDSDSCLSYSNVNSSDVTASIGKNAEKNIADYKGDKNPGQVRTIIDTPYSNGYCESFISDQLAEKDWAPWSFYVTSGYSSGEKFQEQSGWEYGDTADETYFVPVKARYYYESGTSSRVRNVFISPSERFGIQSTMIRIFVGNKVSFYANTPNMVRDGNGQTVVCYKAPVSGIYRVNAVLAAADSNDSDNMARCTVLKNGQTMETAENSQDFAVNGTEYSMQNVRLNKEDKIFIRISAGNKGYAAGIEGNITVSRIDENGETLYSLADIYGKDIKEIPFGVSAEYTNSGKLIITAANTSEAMISGELYGAVYLGNAVKKIIKLRDVQLNSDVKYSFDTDELNLEPGMKAKLFLWNSAGKMIPLQECTEFEKGDRT